MLTLLLFALLQNFAPGDPYGFKAQGSALSNWHNCTLKAAEQMSGSNEAAGDVAAAALSQCDAEQGGYEATLGKMFTQNGGGISGLDEAKRQTSDLRAKIRDGLIAHVIQLRSLWSRAIPSH